MTQSTEQERAEFEKYMLLENYFSERDLVWNGVDGYDCTDADDAFGIWLIARRAQVVPQAVIEAARQVHRLVRAHTFDMQHGDQSKPAWEGCTKDAVRVLQYLVDASAAPQPPEAAPVQMPDPAASAYMSEPKDDGAVCTEMMINPVLCKTGWNKLYTEHQVLEIIKGLR